MKALLIFLTLLIIGCGPTKFVPEVSFAEQAKEKKTEIDWQPFNDKLLKVSLALNKPLFVLITSKNCGHCKKLMNETLSDEIVIDEINKRFISTRLDTKDRYASMFYTPGKTGVPLLLFAKHTDGSGRQLRFVGESGFKNQFKLLELMNEVEQKLNEPPIKKSP